MCNCPSRRFAFVGVSTVLRISVMLSAINMACRPVNTAAARISSDMAKVVSSRTLVVCSVLALAPHKALAWGAVGHRLVGQIGAEEFSPEIPLFLRTQIGAA